MGVAWAHRGRRCRAASVCIGRGRRGGPRPLPHGETRMCGARGRPGVVLARPWHADNLTGSAAVTERSQSARRAMDRRLCQRVWHRGVLRGAWLGFRARPPRGARGTCHDGPCGGGPPRGAAAPFAAAVRAFSGSPARRAEARRSDGRQVGSAWAFTPRIPPTVPHDCTPPTAPITVHASDGTCGGTEHIAAGNAVGAGGALARSTPYRRGRTTCRAGRAPSLGTVPGLVGPSPTQGSQWTSSAVFHVKQTGCGSGGAEGLPAAEEFCHRGEQLGAGVSV